MKKIIMTKNEEAVKKTFAYIASIVGEKKAMNIIIGTQIDRGISAILRD